MRNTRLASASRKVPDHRVVPMKRTLLWLNPKTGLRGLVFGYLFGLVGWLVVIAAFVLRSSDPAKAFWRELSVLWLGFLWAIPWTVLWGLSGTLHWAIPRYPASVITACSVVAGTTYSLTIGTWGGWQTLTIPFNSAVAAFLFHLPGFGIVAMIYLSREDQ
jgi:hypothetical protein